jgi:hypothetical protein
MFTQFGIRQLPFLRYFSLPPAVRAQTTSTALSVRSSAATNSFTAYDFRSPAKQGFAPAAYDFSS